MSKMSKMSEINEFAIRHAQKIESKVNLELYELLKHKLKLYDSCTAFTLDVNMERDPLVTQTYSLLSIEEYISNEDIDKFFSSSTADTES